MKKLLLIFSLFLPMITLSTNTVSCFGRHNNSGSSGGGGGDTGGTTIITPKNNDAIIPSTTSTGWYSSLNSAKYINLINDNQQLVIPSIVDSSPLSNINLDFSSGWTVNDNCSENTSNILQNKNYYYITTSCDKNISVREQATSPDSNGNYQISDTSSITLTGYKKILSSNNKVFAFSNANLWFDITNPNSLKQITNSDMSNVIYMWNSPDNTLYGLTTSEGLTISSDNGTTWRTIYSTAGLQLTSITGNSDKIFLATGVDSITGEYQGLWEYDAKSAHLTQVKDTDNKMINAESIFMSNDNNNLFYGIENEGLYELPGLDVDSPEQLVGNNGLITSTTNIKDIKETKDNLFLLLTNTDIITYE